MSAAAPDRLRVFIDSDVAFAGSASATGASHLTLLLGELGLIEACVSAQVRAEVERNLAAKLPAALPAFRALMDACCRTVPDTGRARADEIVAADMADPKDALILATALDITCDWLLTFNLRDYRAGGRIRAATPGAFVAALREKLLALAP